MNIRQQVNLKLYNTLALDAVAEYFCDAISVEDLNEAIAYARQHKLPISVIGGGSNIILAPRIAGLVMRVMIPGINQLAVDDNGYVLIQAGAGENWHQLVDHCLANGRYGLENLSLIPGSCGAAPIQNIGAYGVELDTVFHSLDAIDIATGEQVTLNKTDCQFSYRSSIFKNAWQGRFIITALRLKLSSTPAPHIEYPALQQALSGQNPASITPELVAKTVCAIRTGKLPDPTQMPNVGSFFKNPIVDASLADNIRAEHPNLVSYPASAGKQKLAAAWLIDQAGWKGYRQGNVGVHNQQALVLVNTGNATGEEVLDLADKITQSVKQCYGVELEREPQRIGW